MEPPICFICGSNKLDAVGYPNEIDNLKGLLVGVCHLLNLVDVSTEDWNFLTGSQQQCCQECHNLLGDVERVHEALQKTQAQLKTYFGQLETLVASSEMRDIQKVAWHESCLKFRRHIIQKSFSKNGASQILPCLGIKEELSSTQNNPLLDDNFVVADNWDDYGHEEQACLGPMCSDYDSYGNITLHQNTFVSVIPEDGTNPALQIHIRGDKQVNVPCTTSSNLNCTESQLDSTTVLTSKCRRRRIIVVAEEDEKLDESNKKGRSTVVGRAAKQRSNIVACDIDTGDIGGTNKKDKSDRFVHDLPSDAVVSKNEDDEYKINRTSAGAYDEQDDPLQFLVEKNFFRKGRPLVLWVPILVAGENLFLYKYGTFIRYTYSHLRCLAHKCSFQTEFDYYPSFQKMRHHIEEIHRSRKHRQQIAHHCYICNTQFKNQDQLRKHFRTAHDELKPTSAKAVCESCMVITRNTVSRGHQWSHKNESEKALAREIGDGNARCFRPTEREMTEKKYICDWENCTAAFKSMQNWKRHKRTHLPVEERTDMTLCTECGDRVLKEKLFDHMVRRHNPSMATRTLVCPVCDKRYLASDNALFQDHVKGHRGNQEKSFMCTQCAAVFVSNARLTAHVKNAHGNESLPCPWCDKVYTKRISFIAHQKRRHTDEYNKSKRRPHTKKQSKFYYNEELERARKEHFIGPVQKYPCPICDVVFKYRHSIKKHMRNKHESGSCNGDRMTKGRNRLKSLVMERKVEVGTSAFGNSSSHSEETSSSNCDNIILYNHNVDTNTVVLSNPSTVFISSTRPQIFGHF